MLRISLLLLTFVSIAFVSNAQKFASASKGIFSDAQKVVVMSIDSVEATYTFNTEAASEIEEPDVFYLIDENGNEVELEPEEILYIEISRGDESKWIAENLEEEEDEEDDEDAEYVEVFENTEATERLIYERVEMDNSQGTPFSGRNREGFYLLQLVNDSIGEFIKVYVSPNFDYGGTQVAPLGELTDELARDRVNYSEYEAYYIIKIGDEPAIRISSDQYLEYAPLIFNKSREFRKKYSIPREMSKERTKKRKKTARKDVGKKKVKASPLRFDEFPKHVKDFQKAYVIEEAARQKKIAEREAAREAARGN